MVRPIAITSALIAARYGPPHTIHSAAEDGGRMGGIRRLTIEEKLAIHKLEQALHPDAFIMVNATTDTNGLPIIIRRPQFISSAN